MTQDSHNGASVSRSNPCLPVSRKVPMERQTGESVRPNLEALVAGTSNTVKDLGTRFVPISPTEIAHPIHADPERFLRIEPTDRPTGQIEKGSNR